MQTTQASYSSGGKVLLGIYGCGRDYFWISGKEYQDSGKM
jgi:hypothetical protein